ncbi:hypothetical protein E2P81_ATG09778 [Venturia nashicola]|uniref:Uncharacterized protein n=1 Tax=Venturia nashicola TaxID=86259 RepID=A0A4Z1NBZ0_9PEZI|nr:hypothetical protein E6O75_ATG09995 [Venturia nashicola]TLD14788.1 hypothetical protein E2P81_ATG09778 [Venturia nashicola]
MPSVRSLSTVLLLAATSLAAPFFSGVTNKVVARDGAAPCSPLPCVANRIMYVMETVTVPYGSASTPTAGSSGSAVAPVATASSVASSQAGTPPASAPVPMSAAPATSAAGSSTPASNVAPSTGSLTADTLLQIMPLSGSCDGGRNKVPGNCRTAAQAAAPLQKGFDDWKITVKGAQAANLALIAFESEQMMYKVSVGSPPTPGKGTYAVMMPPNVKLYATQLKGEAAVAAAGTVEKILDLVNTSDDDAFGAASWYMSTQCPGAQDKFSGDVDAAFASYITDCVHGGDMEKRQATWTNAKKAFGL